MPETPAFDNQTLAKLLSVSVETIAVWDANGVGPDYFEQETPQGVKRFRTPEAVKAFVLKHRAMRRVAPGAQNPRDPSPPLFGGSFKARA